MRRELEMRTLDRRFVPRYPMCQTRTREALADRGRTRGGRESECIVWWNNGSLFLLDVRVEKTLYTFHDAVQVVGPRIGGLSPRYPG
jgi:hypothetical protein